MRAGWLPFEMEIGGVLRPGANQIAVHVTAPMDDPEYGSARPWPATERRA